MTERPMEEHKHCYHEITANKVYSAAYERFQISVTLAWCWCEDTIVESHGIKYPINKFHGHVVLQPVKSSMDEISRFQLNVAPSSDVDLSTTSNFYEEFDSEV